MSEHSTLIAFIALLVSILILAGIGAYTGQPADLAVMTGLIGLGGALIPRRAASPAEPPAPVNVAEVGGEPVKP